jgi:hypothetical protein
MMLCFYVSRRGEWQVAAADDDGGKAAIITMR